ncbi:MAG: thioredoxin family protein [Acidimicrobiia bacterium]
MTATVLVVVAVMAVAAVIAVLVERRRPEAPTQPEYGAPTQLDRADFPRPDAPWLVALFSSATCDSCERMREKAHVLSCDDVAVVDVEWSAERDLHERYRIEAVPTLVIADADGVVRRHFVGSATATDLWAAVAEVRAPGSTPEPELGAS